MRKMNALDWLFLVLLVIGGINWGLIGFFGVDLVASLFGPMSSLSRIVYVLVGVSAIYEILRLANLQSGREEARR